MAGSTISVKITGDSTEFVKAAKASGDAAKAAAEESESGLGKLNETAEASTKQFRGAADTIDGATAALSTFGINIPGQQVITLTRGLADLADGFSTTLGPALEKVAAKLGLTTAATEAETTATEEATVAEDGLKGLEKILTGVRETTSIVGQISRATEEQITAGHAS